MRDVVKLPTSLLLAALAFAPGCVGAKEAKKEVQGPVLAEPAQQAPGPPPAEWQPPEPEEDGWVWIRLTNGEWLKGELEVLRKDSLEFESDELGDLNLDWDDVAELRSPQITTVRLESGRILVGTVQVRDGEAAIRTDQGEQRFPRGELFTILPGRPGEHSRLWSGTLSLGVTARAGNSDQIDMTAYLLARRRTATNRFTFSYNGVYSETNETQIANNARIDTDLRYFVDRRSYVTPIKLIAYRDPFQNIDVQAIPGAGVGYQLVDDGDLDWEVNGGLGWLYTRYISVEPGEDDELSSTVLLLGTELNDDLTKKLELGLHYEFQLPFAGDIGGVNHHLQVRTSLDLWNDLDLDVAFVWDHQGNPVRNENGEVPLKNDYRLVFGLGWDF